MKINRKQLEDSILYLANEIGGELGVKVYTEFLKEAALPKTVKNLVYDLFLNKFLYFSCKDDTYNAYKHILEYALELNEKGFVTFVND